MGRERKENGREGKRGRGRRGGLRKGEEMGKSYI